jgi:hypothetical protein
VIAWSSSAASCSTLLQQGDDTAALALDDFLKYLGDRVSVLEEVVF